MARYIDADKLLEYNEERHKHLCEQYGETDAYCQGYEDAMYVAEHLSFAADVVPRRNVEELRKQLDAKCDRCIEREKADVERIFAEIEFEIANLAFDRDETRAIAIEGIIANAKKKYTEGKK